MDVLALLAERNGQPVSQDEIIEAVWGKVALSKGALFRYISQLRSALGDDARRPRYIETIPKRGYRLAAPVDFEAKPAPRWASNDIPLPARKLRLVAWHWAAICLAAVIAAALLWPQFRPQTEARTPLAPHAGQPSPDPSSPAYRALRLGDFFEDRVDCDAYRKAKDAFEQASAHYSEALYELVQIHFAAAVIGCWPAQDSYRQIELLSKRAELPEAQRHLALGGLAMFRDLDLPSARQHLEQARQSLPGLIHEEVLFAALQVLEGDIEKGLETARRIAQRSVTDPGEVWAVGLVLYFGRRYDEAIEHFRSMEEVFPAFQPARAILALSLLESRRYSQALEAARRIPEPPGPPSRFALLAGFIYAAAGERDQAQRFLRRWESRARGQWVSPSAMALLYAGTGQSGQALAWLEKGRQQQDPWMAFVGVDPAFDSLRNQWGKSGRQKAKGAD
jgi:tetratricopeptide (TPR) repeat protein